jgi:toxin ParE1/3/4
MKGFRLSPEAARDIREICAYIRQDSPQAARRIRSQLLAACRKLSRAPGMGHSREDLTEKPVLFWPVGSYLVIYNPSPKPVEVVRVLHGKRGIPNML